MEVIQNGEQKTGFHGRDNEQGTERWCKSLNLQYPLDPGYCSSSKRKLTESMDNWEYWDKKPVQIEVGFYQ